MMGVPPPATPGSRTLAAWWRQLAPWQPRSLHVGLLLVHRLEALVRVRRAERLDNLASLVLHASAEEIRAVSGASVTTETLRARLYSRLPGGARLLARALRDAVEQHLLACDAGGVCSLTALGEAALIDGEFPRFDQRRRAFYFLEGGLPEQTPLFIDLAPHAATPWTARETWPFEVGVLRDCVTRPGDWKQRHGFPLDVAEILTNPGAEPPNNPRAGLASELWRRVVLHRPEQLLAVLCRGVSPMGHEAILGFKLESEGWMLRSQTPVFRLAVDNQETVASALGDNTIESWRSSWLHWCRSRGLSREDAELCALSKRDHLLIVHPPRRLLDRLTFSRGEMLKGDAWLLAGDGLVKEAALLQVEEHPSSVD